MVRYRGIAARAGRWSARHRKTAIAGWLVFVIASLALGSAIGTVKLANDQGGTGSSGAANAVLHRQFRQPAQEQVLITSPVLGAPEHSARFRAAVDQLTARLRALPGVSSVRSPYAPGNAGQLSRDQHSALIELTLRGNPDSAQDRVQPVLAVVAGAQRAHPRLRIGEFGEASAIRALNAAMGDDLQHAEMLSLPVTLVILVVVFGALVAASVPVLLAISAVAATLGLVAIPSHLFALDGAASSVIVLIGMAVGVDYALFYVRREREERAAGRTAAEALEVAGATSGRAVLVSGMTVMIAMAGMFLTGNATFASFAAGTMIVVAVAMIGSITFLPAMLAVLGDRIDKGRIPFLGRRRRDRRSVSSLLLRPVLSHPRMSALLATGLLLALAAPALALHTEVPGARSVPANLPVMKTYARIQSAFPGSPAPAMVVIQAPDVGAGPVRAAITKLETEAARTGQISGPMSVAANRAGTVAVVQLSLAGQGTDAASNRALATLRDRLIPDTLGQVPGVTARVTGQTAQSKDFGDLLSARTPWVFAFVLGLAFLLLLATFRSLVIPITAIALNLLSVGAAYGVLTLVFQHHWAEGLLGFKWIGSHPPGVTSWLPLFMFVILFGLSMDYHVFILSRIKEARDRGLSTRDAVSQGIGSTAGVVTSAAAVMVAVFAIFATLSLLELKEFGVGLAVAVLIDATIIRGVLLPATMTILGERNWYLPRLARRAAPLVGARQSAL